jgi:VIT1/CCC1 family predicted Fe2+/Mn2+ transporter
MTRTLPDHLAAERHLGGRAAWLRAAVLGANDGLISTSSLMIGVAAASAGTSAILVSGVAGLTAGALSMAAGEYVSVSSQRDTEQADLARERAELDASPEAEFGELVEIYERRGLSHGLAHAVAVELSEFDQLAVHARDELGIDPDALANPLQAAVVSAVSFVVGAVLPIVVMAADRARRGDVVLTVAGPSPRISAPRGAPQGPCAGVRRWVPCAGDSSASGTSPALSSGSAARRVGA